MGTSRRIALLSDRGGEHRATSAPCGHSGDTRSASSSQILIGLAAYRDEINPQQRDTPEKPPFPDTRRSICADCSGAYELPLLPPAVADSVRPSQWTTRARPSITPSRLESMLISWEVRGATLGTGTGLCPGEMERQWVQGPSNPPEGQVRRASSGRAVY